MENITDFSLTGVISDFCLLVNISSNLFFLIGPTILRTCLQTGHNLTRLSLEEVSHVSYSSVSQYRMYVCMFLLPKF
jgi:hypothetical protein